MFESKTKIKTKTTFLKRCKNCGRTNHLLSTCKDPITSCGIICIKIKNVDMFNKINNFLLNYENILNIYAFNNFNHKNISIINKYIDKLKLIDSFRILHPDEKDHYTFWSYMAKSREKNKGWRIDYIMVSSSIRENLQSANILSDVVHSDHCPIKISLKV